MIIENTEKYLNTEGESLDRINSKSLQKFYLLEPHLKTDL